MLLVVIFVANMKKKRVQMEDNENEVLVKVTLRDILNRSYNKFERFKDKREYKSFIAELIKGYKNTTYNVCTYTIHGLIRVIVSNKDSKIVEKYQEL